MSQKELIEKRGGLVVVAGTNPSPSEITEGIKTIAGSDLSIATATEEDVKRGKTFYSGSPELKTGTADMDTESIHYIFMANPSEQATEDMVYYTCPDYLTVIRASCFESNYNRVTITFNDNLTKIGQYAFFYAKNFAFTNMSEITKLQTISQYAFKGCGCEGVDFGSLPDSITTIDICAFENVLKENQNLKLPSSLKTMSNSAFKQASRTLLNSFDASNCQLTSLSNSACYNLAFNCDFVVPSNIQLINVNFNYNGCFKNLVFHENLTIYNYAFGGATSRPLSEFFLKSVVFEAETPPTVGAHVFADQNMTNGFKIYVPDNSVEAYKAVSNLVKYADYIYPISQKE